MNITTFVQTKAKAIAGALTTFVGTILALYQANQSLTLKQVIAALIAGIVGGAIVHQTPKNKQV